MASASGSRPVASVTLAAFGFSPNKSSMTLNGYFTSMASARGCRPVASVTLATFGCSPDKSSITGTWQWCFRARCRREPTPLTDDDDEEEEDEEDEEEEGSDWATREERKSSGTAASTSRVRDSPYLIMRDTTTS